MTQISGLRRLPFTGPEGKPAYVPEGGSGIVTALADGIEAAQVEDALAVVDHAKALLTGDASIIELRWACERLCEAVSVAVSVAECRGDRIPLGDE